MQRELSDTMRDFSTTTTTMISFSKLENNVDNARLTPELKWQKAQIFTVCTSITLNGTESTRYVLGVLVRCGQYIVHHAKRGARTYWYMFENRRKNTPAVAHVFKTLCTISTTQARVQPPNGCRLLLVTSSVGVPLRAGRANILHLSISPPAHRACAPLRTSDQITLTWH